ncbi:hypothetical protein VPH35_002338 [Triticum aestivum]
MCIHTKWSLCLRVYHKFHIERIGFGRKRLNLVVLDTEFMPARSFMESDVHADNTRVHFSYCQEEDLGGILFTEQIFLFAIGDKELSGRFWFGRLFFTILCQISSSK